MDPSMVYDLKSSVECGSIHPPDECDLGTTGDNGLIGKPKIYPRAGLLPLVRLMRSVDHVHRHFPEGSMNGPGVPLSSNIGSLSASESDPAYLSPSDAPSSSYVPPAASPQLDQFSSTTPAPASPSPPSFWGQPTSTSDVANSTLSSSDSSLLSTSLVASGSSQTIIPTASAHVKNPHVGAIVGGVLGGVMVILLGVAFCYFLSRRTRRKRTHRTGYDNLASEDERPYLQADDHLGRYLQIDDDSLAFHRLGSRETDEQGRYTPWLRRSPKVSQYALQDLTVDDAGHRLLFSSRTGERSRSVQFKAEDPSSVRGNDAESDSGVNEFGEGFRAKIRSSLGSTSSSGSVQSWARFAGPRASLGSVSSSRTTIVDMDQISLPRPLQKYQRPMRIG